MTQLVEHIVEPSVLLLAWQAPDHLRNRRRWLVAKIDVASSVWTLTYLTGSAFEHANGGASYSQLEALGYEGYPAFSTSRASVHQHGVREAILRRLPPRQRSDFGIYAQQFGLSAGGAISDAALAAYTGAKVPSDGFSIAAELERSTMIGDLVLEVAGARHQIPDDCALRVSDPLELRPEPDNEHDQRAIAVYSVSCRIGYINRLQTDALHFWLSHRSIVATIQRVNGRAGSPRVHALIKVRPQALNEAA